MPGGLGNSRPSCPAGANGAHGSAQAVCGRTDRLGMARNASETTHCGGLKWRQPIVLVQKRRSELKGDRRKSGAHFSTCHGRACPGHPRIIRAERLGDVLDDILRIRKLYLFPATFESPNRVDGGDNPRIKSGDGHDASQQRRKVSEFQNLAPIPLKSLLR